MIYDDELMPTTEIMSKMNNEYNNNNVVSALDVQIEVCEMNEYRQKAEMEEIFSLLSCVEEFFKWLESKDASIGDIKKLLEQATSDKITAQGCGGRCGLDYRYACDNDFNHNCQEYCKCEMEIIDKVIKILSLKNSIIDKQCMIKLLQSRMDALKFIFNRYCK